MNIEKDKVVAGYEQNLKKNGTVSCYGLLKLLNDLLEDPDRDAEWNVDLRLRLYNIMANGGDKLFLGQYYAFDDRKPRDDLYVILRKENFFTTDSVDTIKRALRSLPTTEKDAAIARKRLSDYVEVIRRKVQKEDSSNEA